MVVGSHFHTDGASMKSVLVFTLLLAPVGAHAATFEELTQKMDVVRSSYEVCLMDAARYYGAKLCRDVSEIVPGVFGKCTDLRVQLENLIRDRGDAGNERTRQLQTIRENATDSMTAIILDQQIAENCQPK